MKKLKTIIVLIIAIFVLLILPESSDAQSSITGMGIMGASSSDEYRSDENNRGGIYAPWTFNWMEQLADTSSEPTGKYAEHKVSKNIDFGVWGDYGPTRNQGFSFNWARSGDMSKHLKDQYPGLVQQIASNEVSHVVIMMGQNDFNTLASYGNYEEIYNDTLSDAELAFKLDTINANFVEAVNALKTANPNIKIIVTTISDTGLGSDIENKFPIPSKEVQMYCLLNNIPSGTGNCQRDGRLRVSYAIKDINAMLSASLAPKGVYIADLHGWVLQKISQLDEEGKLYVGGVGIDMTKKGNEPHNGQLADSIGHGGTVYSGLIANFISDSLNKAYQTGVPLFSDCEILVNAGIKQPSDCPSSPTQTPQPGLLGDIDGNKVVNIQDYILLSNAFGTADPLADLDGNGIVNIQDYTILSNNFGETAG